MTHHNEEGFFMVEVAGGYLLKTLVINAFNNRGYYRFIELRQIDLMFGGIKIPLINGVDYTAYATTQFSPDYQVGYAFDTTTNKLDGVFGEGWLSGDEDITNQRLICNLNTPRIIDGLVLNNGHSFGTVTDRGVKDAEIYITEDDFINPDPVPPVPNSTLIFGGVFPEHPASNTVQDYSIPLIG